MDNALPPPRLIRQPVKFRYLGAKPKPPLPLVGDGLMHPLAVTLLYGPGGIGKGMVACYLVRALRAEECNPLILDFEGVESEWEFRLNSLGVEAVPYFPVDRALTSIVVADVRAAMAEDAITHIIIDSASAAKGRTTDADSGGQDVTMSLFRMLRSFGAPIFMIGHEGKKGDTPIGSTHFLTQSRLVWRGKGIANGIELQMVKANDRQIEPSPRVFSWIGNETELDIISGWLPEEKPETVTDAILRIVASSDKSLSPSDVQIILGREGSTATLASVNALMGKLVRTGRLEKAYRGRYRNLTNPIPLGRGG